MAPDGSPNLGMGERLRALAEESSFFTINELGVVSTVGQSVDPRVSAEMASTPELHSNKPPQPGGLLIYDALVQEFLAHALERRRRSGEGVAALLRRLARTR